MAFRVVSIGRTRFVFPQRHDTRSAILFCDGSDGGWSLFGLEWNTAVALLQLVAEPDYEVSIPETAGILESEQFLSPGEQLADDMTVFRDGAIALRPGVPERLSPDGEVVAWAGSEFEVI